MKKLLMIPLLFSMAACSSGNRAPSSKLNCEKLEKDSDAKLIELQKIFGAYQEVNYDLAVKLAPSLREEAEVLEARIKKLKQRCWPGDNRAVDNEMASLKSELVKVYGNEPVVPKKSRVPASRAPAPPPMPEAPKSAVPELITDTPAAIPTPATPAAVGGDDFE